MIEWQPIETLPNDGRVEQVIVMPKDSPVCDIGIWLRLDSGDGMWFLANNVRDHYSHWAPINKPEEQQ